MNHLFCIFRNCIYKTRFLNNYVFLFFFFSICQKLTVQLKDQVEKSEHFCFLTICDRTCYKFLKLFKAQTSQYLNSYQPSTISHFSKTLQCLCTSEKCLSRQALTWHVQSIFPNISLEFQDFIFFLLFFPPENVTNSSNSHAQI